MKKKLKRIDYTLLAPWALLLVVIGNMLMVAFKLPEPFLWTYQVIIVFILFRSYKKLKIKEVFDKQGLYLTIFFMCWLWFNFFRAAFLIEGYWMWKNVIGQLFITFFYFAIFLCADINIIQDYYRIYWRYFLVLVIASMALLNTPLFLNYLPYSTLMLFFGLIQRNKKWLLFGVVVFYLFANFQRNDIAKILVTIAIGFTLSYFYKRIPKWGFKVMHAVLLFAPIILMWLAVTDTFNVFKMDDYIQGDYEQKVETSTGGVEEDDLKADTRTILYLNVFSTMNKYDAWVMGRSPAFGDEGVDGFWGKDDETGLVGRYGNEVGVLDILLWYGCVGVVLYFLIFIRASYVAIYQSNSRYAKGVGIYVAFLWMWSFIWEKPMFETFFLMDLIMIGLCFSVPFRQMDDDEVREWVRGIFTKKVSPEEYIIQHESSMDLERAVS